MQIFKINFLTTTLSLLGLYSFSQNNITGNSTSNASIDATLRINQSINNKNNSNGSYQNIGNFKVTGSQYFNDIALNGKAFKNGKIISYDKLMYDTYLQQLMFKTPNDNGYMYDSNLVDSFVINLDVEKNINADIHFVSGLLFDKKLRGFYQKLYINKNITVLKLYNTSIEISTSNYAQNDLREFTNTVEYFFVEQNETTYNIKKIKLSKNWFKSNFIKNTPAINFLENGNIDIKSEKFLLTFFSFF